MVSKKYRTIDTFYNFSYTKCTTFKITLPPTPLSTSPLLSLPPPLPTYPSSPYIPLLSLPPPTSPIFPLPPPPLPTSLSSPYLPPPLYLPLSHPSFLYLPPLLTFPSSPYLPLFSLPSSSSLPPPISPLLPLPPSLLTSPSSPYLSPALFHSNFSVLLLIFSPVTFLHE